MFKISEIKELIKLVDQTSVHELEIENEGCRIAIRKPGKSEVVTIQSAPAAHTYTPASVQAPVAAVEQIVPAKEEAAPAAVDHTAGLHKIVSPMVGTFYSAPSPDADVFVSVGSKVSEKTVVCILEAMKLMNELEAEVKGQIVEVLVENGQLVEFGQPLFLVKAE
ncbi:acetyl-CoA carboxylase biotin carboxyl carrier protein [Paenibacillus sp. SC116]|uniref:acetyl-CoA carboxylase biotin carboxyl carrier protein n=1 Tax=Paenibacillus sp. SC116 TaxID=2968986 RepID=UPI00215A363F|nr:acetyl-CoA carboxylase biotin carboxyl carrier protein [Paenibacillus sp. SC116]MCR8843166.1 acetyl-CoA carboxylase biotin carboxyl carrier protein [Paenibacillus sp. SC116]